MDIRTRLFAMAGVPLLSLIASLALAGEAPTPDLSDQLRPPPLGVGGTLESGKDAIIKNANQCPAGTTFFKNQFPSLTNGTLGGSTTIDFIVEGESVSMTVTWDSDNSFKFNLSGAVAHWVGVTVDTNNFIYKYAMPVLDDAKLNYYLDDTIAADDVNHLDLCLAKVDDVAPVLSEITVEPSPDDTTVSGEISIIISITDESAQNVVIEIFPFGLPDDDYADYIHGLIVAQDPTPCDNGNPECTTYTWKLDTSLVDEGDYTIKITSTDLTVLGLSDFKTKNITVVRSLLDCLDNTDGVPGVPDGPSSGGCNLTGAVQLEYPGDIEQYVGLLQVSQEFVPVRLDADGNPVDADGSPMAPSSHCDSKQYPNIAHDPRVDYSDGKTYTAIDDPATVDVDERTLDLSKIFDIAPDTVVLSAEVVGSPCLALVAQDAPDFADIAGLLPADFFYIDGPVYTVTQYPAAVEGMYDSIRYTLPLNYCDPSDAQCDSIPTCFITGEPCAQPDPQNVEQAAYQPDDRNDLVRPYAQALTNFIYNPPRTSGMKGSYFPINTREVCPDIPIVDPATPAYIAAVQQCKIDLALRYEADTEQALVEAEALGSLVSPSLNNLLNWLNRAQSQIKNEHFERCVSNLEKLESDVINGEWNDILDPVDGDSRNDQGRVLTYVRNLTWRCEQLLITEAYLESLP